MNAHAHKPQFDVLEDRCMLSANPWSELAAPPRPSHMGLLVPAVQKVRAFDSRAGSGVLKATDSRPTFSHGILSGESEGLARKIKLENVLVSSLTDSANKGNVIPKAVLYGRKSGDDKRMDYLTIKLTDILISSFTQDGKQVLQITGLRAEVTPHGATGGAGAGKATFKEFTLTLTREFPSPTRQTDALFSQPQLQWAPVKAGYDLAANKRI